MAPLPIPGRWLADPDSAWLQVANDDVRRVGTLDGFSDRTRGTLSHTYFAEGGDADRFMAAAEQRGIDVLEDRSLTFESVSRVRFMGRFQPALVLKPLAPGDSIDLADGGAATVNRLDRDRLTGMEGLVVERDTPNGPQTRFVPGEFATRAIRFAPAPTLRAEARPTPDAPANR